MIKYAKNLLEWNKKYLVYNSNLNQKNIAEIFAKNFIVKANGREYSADYDNYLVFLNGFKKTIQSIDYEVQEYITDNHCVVFPLVATIIRTDGQIEKYQAMLLLKIDDNGLITWWQEVYTKLEN